MRKTVLMLSAVSLAFGASTLVAQAKPNFAGKWAQVVDPNAPQPGRGGRGGLGQSPSIEQTDKTLTITRTTQAGEVKSVYNLDGTDSKNTQQMGGNAVESMAHAKWDGSKLVITTTTEFNGNKNESTMALSIDGSGNLMVESTGVGRGGGAPTTTTATYKKA